MAGARKDDNRSYRLSWLLHRYYADHSDGARLALLALSYLSDDAGRLVYHPAEVRSVGWTYRPDSVTDDQVEAYVRELVDHGVISLYEDTDPTTGQPRRLIWIRRYRLDLGSRRGQRASLLPGAPEDPHPGPSPWGDEDRPEGLAGSPLNSHEDALGATFDGILDEHLGLTRSANRGQPGASRREVPYQEIIDLLNWLTGRKFGCSPATRKLIRSRWREGNRLPEFRDVIADRVERWGHDPIMAEYLRPSTLFGSKFSEYLTIAREARRRKEIDAAKYRYLGRPDKAKPKERDSPPSYD